MRISEWRLRRRVRFYEVDGAGIVHFSWYFRYMEEAEYELWRSAGLRAADLPGIVLPRVAASFDYRRPLRFEDEFEARIQITSIREKSIAYSCVLTLGEETIATGTMAIACVRTAPGEPMRAISWPAEIGERLEAAPPQP
ncbi:MAG TPA: thioesterase family protein [Vicinamibacterales bacterium]|jgi:YbgC/YbaW family acyl-CoA thioester hydrolase|nr:thioesterase family protein [Vicinamibacterales bacterium]